MRQIRHRLMPSAHTQSPLTCRDKIFSSVGVRATPALRLSRASRKAFSLYSQSQWQSTHAPRTPNCRHRSSHNQHSDLRLQEFLLHWSESQALSFAGVWGEMFASLEFEPRISPCLFPAQPQPIAFNTCTTHTEPTPQELAQSSQ